MTLQFRILPQSAFTTVTNKKRQFVQCSLQQWSSSCIKYYMDLYYSKFRFCVIVHIVAYYPHLPTYNPPITHILQYKEHIGILHEISPEHSVCRAEGFQIHKHVIRRFTCTLPEYIYLKHPCSVYSEIAYCLLFWS